MIYSIQDTIRSPGDRWMIRGPKEYVPPVEVEVVLKRQAIPLDENEGIYVRDIKTGKVSHFLFKHMLLRFSLHSIRDKKTSQKKSHFR